MIKENNNCMKPYRSWHQSIELEFNSYVPETIDSSNNINSDKKCCINAPVQWLKINLCIFFGKL